MPAFHNGLEILQAIMVVGCGSWILSVSIGESGNSISRAHKGLQRRETWLRYPSIQLDALSLASGPWPSLTFLEGPSNHPSQSGQYAFPPIRVDLPFAELN